MDLSVSLAWSIKGEGSTPFNSMVGVAAPEWLGLASGCGDRDRAHDVSVLDDDDEIADAHGDGENRLLLPSADNVDEPVDLSDASSPLHAKGAKHKDNDDDEPGDEQEYSCSSSSSVADAGGVGATECCVDVVVPWWWCVGCCLLPT